MSNAKGKMEVAAWGDVLRIVNGRNQKAVENPNGKYPIYGSGGVMGFADSYLCDAGTTIIGRKGSINSPLFVESKFWNVDTAFGLSAGERLDKKYLYYFCLTYDFLRHNKSTTLPSLVKADLLEIKIPLPSLAEQQRITAILDAADAHRQKTKALLEKYDQLAQSIFLEMFGDPVTNERGWETIEVRQIAHIVRGSSPRPKGDPRYYGEGVPRLMVADLTRDGMYVQPKIDSLTHEGAKLSRPMKAGDLVMAVSGRPGVSAILLCDCCIHDGFIGFRDLKEQHRKEFLHFYFSYFVENINAKAVGAIFKNLTVEEVNMMRVPVVPTKVQDEFVKKIIHVEDLKLKAVNSFEKSESLFQSLLQGAFKGVVA